MLKNAIQGKYILGSDTKLGYKRDKHEDRIFVGEIQRQVGDFLVVGIVADGVGGADAGERGAQLAIDVTLNTLRASQGDNIPEILDEAIKAANTTVYNENQNSEMEGLTTLVVTVIHKDRCFIGNVGDSRAYWVQDGTNGKAEKTPKLLQLTRDHSYYNIYGGVELESNEANVLVNAIGKKSDVYVDLGFYLNGEKSDEEKALRLGLNGLPIQPGDSIVLCSDGLIKTDLMGARFATDDEIVDAIISEFEPGKSAIKMVSAALGRRTDDNVSAVTIQWPSEDTIQSRTLIEKRTKRNRKLATFTASGLIILLIAVIGVLTNRLQRQPEIIIHTLTPVPTWTPTQPIDPGKARVEQVHGSGANVLVEQYLDAGASIIAGDGGVYLVVGEQGDRTSVIFLFGNGAMQLTDKMMPLLQNGAVYIQPGGAAGEVSFLNFPDARASVSGSRMIVEIQSRDIWTYCFEGTCQLFVGDEGRTIPAGSKRVYRSDFGVWDDSMDMPYDEKWAWNERCNFCMLEIIPTPTPTVTSPSPGQPRPTKKSDDDTYGSIFYWDDRFVALEFERESMLLKTNSFFSLLFSAFLFFATGDKLVSSSRRLTVFISLLIVVFLLART